MLSTKLLTTERATSASRREILISLIVVSRSDSEITALPLMELTIFSNLSFNVSNIISITFHTRARNSWADVPIKTDKLVKFHLMNFKERILK